MSALWGFANLLAFRRITLRGELPMSAYGPMSYLE